MKTSILRGIALVLLAFGLLGLSACQNGAAGEILFFSFHTSAPADSYDEKAFCVSDAGGESTLDVALQMDGGEVSVRLSEKEGGDVIWEMAFRESAAFSIALPSLKKDYLLQIWATDAKDVELTAAARQGRIRLK